MEPEVLVFGITSSWTLTRVGGKTYHENLFAEISPYFGLRSWPVNISKFKCVHPGHFATISRSPGCPGKFWVHGEADGLKNVSKILTHFCIFDPLRVKISTLPPICFMIYYIFLKYKKYKKNKISPNNSYPPFGYYLTLLYLGFDQRVSKLA